MSAANAALEGTTPPADPGATPPADPGATPPADPGATPPATSWTDGLDDEMKGFVENKGFKDPASVLESYRNLEKLRGVPEDKLLKLPDSDDVEGLNAIYEKLGKPKQPTDYELKLPEGLDQDASKPFIDWAQGAFHELGLSTSQAKTLIEKYGEYHKGQLEGFDQEYQTNLKQQQDNLGKEWGAAHEQNMQIARSAMQSFGITADQVDVMEQAMGFDGVMKFLHGIGSKIGEASFEGGDSKTNGVMTPSAAQSEIKDLMKDKGFSEKLRSGDAGAKRRWDQLHVWAYPQQ